MKISILLITVIFFATTCSNITAPTETSGVFFNYLTTFNLVNTSTTSEIQNNFVFMGANSYTGGRLTQFVNYDITAYKILYRTVSVTGNNITASGLIVVPNNATTPPILSYQRGTITSDIHVPSLASINNPEFSLVMRTLAASGFIVVVADLEGHGSTYSLPIPYMHVHSNSEVAFDMLEAAIEFLDHKNIAYRQTLTIVGCSEGAGYAIKMGELISNTRFSSFFDRIDIHAVAGAYHISAFSDSLLLSDRDFNHIGTYLDVIASYNFVYSINNPWSHYIAPEYMDLVAEGNRDNIPLNPSVLFNSSFIENYLSQQDQEMALINAFRDNDVHDLVIGYPIHLYHSINDSFVPFFNALSAYNNLNAPSLELIEYENVSHVETISLFLADFLEIKRVESEIFALIF